MTSNKITSGSHGEAGESGDALTGGAQESSARLEAVDGIMFQIRAEEFTIAGEWEDAPKNISGYSINIAIPKWSMNTPLLKDVRKGLKAQRNLIEKLQTGTDRKWLVDRLVEIDKAMATSLSKIAERNRTRRWREKDREP